MAGAANKREVAEWILHKVRDGVRRLSGNTIVLGIFSLAWLLLRSGTKPSRIIYPCQRAAATSAYTFLLYPLFAFLAGAFKGVSHCVYDAVKHSERRGSIILIVLATISSLFSSLAIYANSLRDPASILSERASLITGEASVSVLKVGDGGVEKALLRAINLIGGIESIVPEGSKILIKPNIMGRLLPRPQQIHP